MSLFSSSKTSSGSRPEDAYQGEWYLPDPDAAAYADYRMREKGYAMIAAILHVIVGFIPAMGLNAVYAAACYAAGLFVVLYQTWAAYRGPSERRAFTLDEYRRYGARPKILSTIARILVILTVIGDVIGNFMFGLDINLWLVLQLVLLLLEALALQFLFRHQRGLTFSVSTKKPAV